MSGIERRTIDGGAGAASQADTERLHLLYVVPDVADAT